MLKVYLILILNILFSESVLSDRYTTYEELEAKINQWDTDFGQNADPYPMINGEGIIFHHEIIGYSGVDNLPIWAIKLSFNANLDEDEPKVLILGQCHAEEIYGVEIAVELIEWLLYPTSPGNSMYFQSLMSVMSQSEIWVVPTHNPEGLNVVHGWYDDFNVWHQDESFRKNKYDANQNGLFDYFYGIGDDVDGVDLNRNYDFNWVFGDQFLETDTGCSANPAYLSNYDYYRGPEAFSEAEIQTIKNFTLNNNFLLSIAYHSSRSGCVAEKVIYPWLWQGGKASPDLSIISRLGDEIASKIPTWDGLGFYYSANSMSRRGNAHDWLYSQTGCVQYLIEVGTSDMQSNDVSLIEDTIDNNMKGLLHLLKRAAGSSIQNGPDPYQITGIVTDPDGNPLSAEVTILELDGPMLKPRLTDSFGRYRRLLIEGTYTLEVEAHGYEPYLSSFVATSSVLDHDVVLNPLQEFNVEFDISVPEGLDIEESPIFKLKNNNILIDSLVVNNEGESFTMNLYEGMHELSLTSNNIFPEMINLDVLSDTTIQIDLKWKGIVLNDDFSSLDNWTNSGGWVLNQYDGEQYLSSQNSPYYNNERYDVLETIGSFSNAYNSSNKYALSLEMKKELEWENDYFGIYLSCDNCDNSMINVTGIDWKNFQDYYFSLDVNSNPSNLSFLFYSDETLNYRGLQIKNCEVLFKPDGECNKGDLNLDGLFNVLDIVDMINIIFETVDSNGITGCVSDMNSNDLVNVNDIVILIEKILN